MVAKTIVARRHTDGQSIASGFLWAFSGFKDWVLKATLLQIIRALSQTNFGEQYPSLTLSENVRIIDNPPPFMSEKSV